MMACSVQAIPFRLESVRDGYTAQVVGKVIKLGTDEPTTSFV
jgi:hypothetical protein